MKEIIKELRKDESIRAPQVRVIGLNGENFGVLSLEQALQKASSVGLDLVEISPKNEPPVCKIMDYDKYRYSQQKKESSARKNQKQIQVKEVKLRPVTDEADFQVKLKHAKRFLEQGDKVKVVIRFRGREVSFQEFGAQLMARLETDLAEWAQVESSAKLEGRQMTMVLNPKKRS